MKAASTKRALDASAIRESIAQELEWALRKSRLRRVYFADSSVAPPALAYITNFPRLSLPLEGAHTMELPINGRPEKIDPVRGQAVFVQGHAWNRPNWADPVKVLTFLFGAKQIGVSLVTHAGGDELNAHAIKTSVASAHDSLSRNILNALGELSRDAPGSALARLLAESLLYSCLRLLRAP